MSRRTPAQDACWQAARADVLARDNRRCTRCGETRGLHVHHLRPRADGGGDDPANLATVCAGCHAAIHAGMQMRLAESAIRGWGRRIARVLPGGGDLPDSLSGVETALALLGKRAFREGQLPIVLAALRGESLLVVQPTGFGKSLCFQAPALLAERPTVVVSPLKALMHDQVAALTAAAIPATQITSDLGAREKALRLRLVDEDGFRLVYVAPERFDPAAVRDPAEIARLEAIRPAFLVIDEAHCVDRWGDDFRPAYGRLADVRRRLGDPPVLAFTATASAPMQERILRSLGVPEARVFVADVDRPNIALVRTALGAPDQRLAAAERLMDRARAEGGKMLIFVPSLRMGDELAGVFAARGRDVPFFHGRVPATIREDLLARMTGRLDPPLDVLLCTNAFGMGVDIPGIRVVLHWAMPGSVEDYAQEVGRAGRDGRPALAVLYDWPGGRSLRRFMVVRGSEEARPGVDADALLARRRGDLDAFERLLRERRSCFRRAMLACFRRESPPPPPLAVRLLELLFGERRRVGRAGFCCDACHPDRAARALGFADHRHLAAQERA